MSEKEWYNNKELFELINGIKDEFNDLRMEMSETRRIISKYNGLYEKVEQVDRELKSLISKQKGKSDFGKAVRDWGGWIFAFITLVILLINQFN